MSSLSSLDRDEYDDAHDEEEVDDEIGITISSMVGWDERRFFLVIARPL